MAHRLPTLWTNSTFLSTVGGAPLSVVKQYIKQYIKKYIKPYIENQQRFEPRPKKSNG